MRRHGGRPYLSEPLFNTHIAFDSEYYLSIAVVGYDDTEVPQYIPPRGPMVPLNYAFLPAYPFAMRIVAAPAAALGMEPVTAAAFAGIAVSLVAALGAMLALHRLARPQLGEDGGVRAAFYLLDLPDRVLPRPGVQRGVLPGRRVRRPRVPGRSPSVAGRAAGDRRRPDAAGRARARLRDRRRARARHRAMAARGDSSAPSSVGVGVVGVCAHRSGRGVCRVGDVGDGAGVRGRPARVLRPRAPEPGRGMGGTGRTRSPASPTRCHRRRSITGSRSWPSSARSSPVPGRSDAGRPRRCLRIGRVGGLIGQRRAPGNGAVRPRRAADLPRPCPGLAPILRSTAVGRSPASCSWRCSPPSTASTSGLPEPTRVPRGIGLQMDRSRAAPCRPARATPRRLRLGGTVARFVRAGIHRIFGGAPAGVRGRSGAHHRASRRAPGDRRRSRWNALLRDPRLRRVRRLCRRGPPRPGVRGRDARGRVHRIRRAAGHHARGRCGKLQRT